MFMGHKFAGLDCRILLAGLNNHLFKSETNHFAEWTYNLFPRTPITIMLINMMTSKTTLDECLRCLLGMFRWAGFAVIW